VTARLWKFFAMVLLMFPMPAGAQSSGSNGEVCKLHPELEWMMNGILELSQAMPKYRQRNGAFPASVEHLGKPEKGSASSAGYANLVSGNWLKPEKHDYQFRYERTQSGWKLWGTALQTHKKLCGSFYTDQTRIIRVYLREGEAPDAVEPRAKRVRIDKDEMNKKLRVRSRPRYPESAKRERLSGLVKLSVVIGVDGAIADILILSGPPALVAATLEAVKAWRYEITVFQGTPVEVETIIEADFAIRG